MVHHGQSDSAKLPVSVLALSSDRLDYVLNMLRYKTFEAAARRLKLLADWIDQRARMAIMITTQARSGTRPNSTKCPCRNQSG